MKKLFMIIALVLPLGLFAQTATVSDFGDLYSTYNLTADDESIIRSKFGQKTLDDIRTYGRETGWPSGFDQLDERSDNRPKLGKFKLEYMCDIDGGNKSIVKAPKSINGHMTGDWALKHDIYFVIRSTSVNVSGGSASASSSSSSKSVTVTDYEELYSTYTLTSDEENQIRNAVGSSTLNDIKRYSQEDEWPSGMKTLDGRNNNRSKMYDYNISYVCNVGDKVVVKVPVSKNSHMPYDMRPTGHDIYFYISASAVSFGGSSGYSSSYSSSSSSSSGGVKVNDYEQLYSTYTLTTSDENEIRGAVGQYVLDDIKRYSQEGEWPSDMSTLDGRNEFRGKMYDYNIEYVCSFGSMVVVKVPASKNSHMSYGMRPQHDIYFIIGDDAVTLSVPVKRGSSGGGNSGTTAPAGGGHHRR